MNNRVIVVPIDGSVDALSAVKYAVQHSKAFQDKIILLNVQSKVDYESLNEYISEAQLKTMQEESANKIFADAIKILDEHSVQYETKVRTGVPSIEISQEAKDQNARAIIMGTRGMGPALSNALGSVSYSLTHLTPCPLTLVPSASNL